MGVLENHQHRYFHRPCFTLDRKNTNPEVYKCSECPGIFENQGKLQQHILQFHGENNHLQDSKMFQVQCSNCEKTFSSEKLMKIHKEIVHIKQKKKKQKYVNLNIETKCQNCGKNFKNSCLLKQHLKRVHDTNKPKVSRPKKSKIPCLKGCKGLYADLKKHNENVHQKEGYQCEICEKTFSLNRSLKTHIKVVHEELRPFRCELCGRTFNRKQQLVYHVKREHEHVKIKPRKKRFGTFTQYIKKIHPRSEQYQ